MTLPTYRSSVEYKEILRILQKASLDRQNFMWQSFEGRRLILTIEHFEIDFVARELVITVADQGKGIDPTKNLYVKLDHRNSVFKISQFKQNKSAIHFSFPVEVKTEELRMHRRTALERERTVSLRPSLGHQRDTGNALNVRVTDISDYGMGLIVSEQNRSFLKNNRILWVTQLHRQELQYPVLAEVVYISGESSSSRKPKELKVGLKLSGVLPQEAVTNFIQ